ncbi:MAG: prepilin peptidase [Actinobacteria bacterium]|nr:prepilin peptidase [Actinomycetota bacterium]MBO0834259.1 prepilin peptidase [Actinomycetota bacterium]
MNPGWTVAGAVAGLVAGVALRSLVVRLSVPAGEPPRNSCPRCTALLPRLIAIRCPRCRARLGPLPLLELACAMTVAALAGRFADTPEVIAFCALGALGIALAAIDLKVQRLPDLLTLPAYPVMLALLAAAAVVGHQPWPLARAVLGGLALAGAYLLLGLIRPGGVGLGDIKLAGLIGLGLGWLGWRTVIDGAMLGLVLAAAVGLALLAARQLTLRSYLSFGPFLIGGALLVMLAVGPGPAA